VEYFTTARLFRVDWQYRLITTYNRPTGAALRGVVTGCQSLAGFVVVVVVGNQFDSIDGSSRTAHCYCSGHCSDSLVHKTDDGTLYITDPYHVTTINYVRFVITREFGSLPNRGRDWCRIRGRFVQKSQAGMGLLSFLFVSFSRG
jgi:hypothetical protein